MGDGKKIIDRGIYKGEVKYGTILIAVGYTGDAASLTQRAEHLHAVAALLREHAVDFEESAKVAEEN